MLYRTSRCRLKGWTMPSLPILPLLAIAKAGAACAKWAAALCALAAAIAHPAPRHASPHRHMPITLPELATAERLAAPWFAPANP
jgi:hypothetical protein